MDKRRGSSGGEGGLPAVVESLLVPVISSDALVLRTYKIGESSKVVVLLTRDLGKLRAVARGARGKRSRYRSALEPMSEVRVGLYGRQGAELYRLGPCELLRSAFRAAGRGLEASLVVQYLAELLDAFAQEGEAEEKVYRLARAAVTAAEEDVAPTSLGRYLEAWLLRLHGLYPALDACAGCARPLPGGPLRYHDAAHGFVCDDCGPASGPFLPLAARAFLAEAFRRKPSDLVEPFPAEAAVLEGFHRDLISRHLERTLRSQRVMKDVARGTSA
jgi:DNA repair protein RecO (recombination protein O)